MALRSFALPPRLSVSPALSWPASFRPKHLIEPVLSRSAHEWRPPAPMAVTRDADADARQARSTQIATLIRHILASHRVSNACSY